MQTLTDCGSFEIEMQGTQKVDEDGLGYSSYGSEEDCGDNGENARRIGEVCLSVLAVRLLWMIGNFRQCCFQCGHMWNAMYLMLEKREMGGAGFVRALLEDGDTNMGSRAGHLQNHRGTRAESVNYKF